MTFFFQIDPPFDVLSQLRIYLSDEENAYSCVNLDDMVNDVMTILTDKKFINKNPSAQKAVRDLQMWRNRGHQNQKLLIPIVETISNKYISRGCQRESDKYKELFKLTDERGLDKERKHKSYEDTSNDGTMRQAFHQSIKCHIKEVERHNDRMENTLKAVSFTTSDEHLIPSEHSGSFLSGNDFDKLLAKTETSVNKMRNNTRISESELLTLQDKIEYLAQIMDSFTSTPLQNKNMDFVRNTFLHVKTTFLSQQLCTEYTVKKHDFSEVLREEAHGFSYDIRFDNIRLYSHKKEVISECGDIFFQNGEMNKNIIVFGSSPKCEYFCYFLVQRWLRNDSTDSLYHTSSFSSDKYPRSLPLNHVLDKSSIQSSNYSSSHSSLGQKETTIEDLASKFGIILANFEYLFILSLKDLKESHLHDIIKRKLLAMKSKYLPIFEQILFRESEKCLIILQDIDHWKPEIKTFKGSNTQETYKLPQRNHMCNYLVIVTTEETDLEKMALGERDNSVYLDLEGLETLRLHRVKRFCKKMIADDIHSSDEKEDGGRRYLISKVAGQTSVEVLNEDF